MIQEDVGLQQRIQLSQLHSNVVVFPIEDREYATNKAWSRELYSPPGLGDVRCIDFQLKAELLGWVAIDHCPALEGACPKFKYDFVDFGMKTTLPHNWYNPTSFLVKPDETIADRFSFSAEFREFMMPEDFWENE